METIKDVFDNYFNHVGEGEVPAIFHRWAFISIVCAAVGRKIHINFGHKNIYPNIYVMFIGDPGTRKSWSIDLASMLLAETGFNKFSNGRTSAEQFAHDLEAASMENMEDYSQRFVNADEFLDFSGSHNNNFISMFTKLFDSPGVYPHRYKNSAAINIIAPFVNILGGCTHATFSMTFPPEIIHTGFLSRLLLVHSEKKKGKITLPLGGTKDSHDRLKMLLTELQTVFEGEIKVSAKAFTAIDTIYHSFEDLSDARFSHYCSRRQTHLLKLCCLMAAMEQKTILSESHVVWANTLLSSIEDRFSQALGEFGKSKHSEVASKFMNALFAAEKPLTAIELWKVVQNDMDSLQDLTKLITGLQTAGKIVRAANGFLPSKHLSQNLPFVDFSLLTKEERPMTKKDLEMAAMENKKVAEELEAVRLIKAKGNGQHPSAAEEEEEELFEGPKIVKLAEVRKQ